MTTAVEDIHIQGNEHWTQKGDAKLFLWEKRRAQNSHGPRHDPVRARLVDGVAADLRSAGAGAAGRDGLFRRPGLRHLVRGHGGLRPLHQGPRHRRQHRRRRRRPEGRDRLHLQDPQPHRPAAGVRHLVGRAARRAVRAAPSRTASSGWRSTPMSGPAKAARRWPNARRDCRNCSRPSAGRSTASSSARSSSATIPAPPTTT